MRTNQRKPNVSKEQIVAARQIDLLSYLQAHEPSILKKSGSNEYTIKGYLGMKISNGLWHWTTKGFGGKSALDFLIKVRHMGFVEAVQHLCGESAVKIPKNKISENTKPKERTPFDLPPSSRDNFGVIQYLAKRGIALSVIEACLENGSIYESVYPIYKNGKPVMVGGKEYVVHNAVFVGSNKHSKPRFACLRGMQKDFKQDVLGSDKRYGFSISAENSNSLVVTESAIDAMSVASIKSFRKENWRDFHYLSLGGVSPLALKQYLPEYPEIKDIYLCLDNDKAGKDGIEIIKKTIREDKALSAQVEEIGVSLPPAGKDYNEYLTKHFSCDKEKTKQIDKRALAR